MLGLHLGIYRGNHSLTEPWYINCHLYSVYTGSNNRGKPVINHDHDQIEMAANSKIHA